MRLNMKLMVTAMVLTLPAVSWAASDKGEGAMPPPPQGPYMSTDNPPSFAHPAMPMHRFPPTDFDPMTSRAPVAQDGAAAPIGNANKEANQNAANQNRGGVPNGMPVGPQRQGMVPGGHPAFGGMYGPPGVPYGMPNGAQYGAMPNGGPFSGPQMLPRPERPDWAKAPQRPERPDWAKAPQRPERPDWAKAPQRPERPDWAKAPQRPERPDWAKAPQRPQPPAWAQAPQQPQPQQPVYGYGGGVPYGAPWGQPWGPQPWGQPYGYAGVPMGPGYR